MFWFFFLVYIMYPGWVYFMDPGFGNREREEERETEKSDFAWKPHKSMSDPH